MKTINKTLLYFTRPDLLLYKMKQVIFRFSRKSNNEFINIEGYRSASDDSQYTKIVRLAATSEKYFKSFKRDPSYYAILENVTEEQGKAYLEILEKRVDSILDNSGKLFSFDNLGNPVKYNYENHGLLSPQTLRYLKVVSDLKDLFGDTYGDVAEIGAGYGGQLLACDYFFKIKRYHIFDLPPVNLLINRYLESFVLNNSFETNTLNTSHPINYDLVISNYAFSELPREYQKVYIEKVLKHSNKGYLTMNSGKEEPSGRNSDKLSIDELRQLLPEFSIIEEKPLTSPHNFIIVWGHNS